MAFTKKRNRCDTAAMDPAIPLVGSLYPHLPISPPTPSFESQWTLEGDPANWIASQCIQQAWSTLSPEPSQDNEISYPFLPSDHLPEVVINNDDNEENNKNKRSSSKNIFDGFPGPPVAFPSVSMASDRESVLEIINPFVRNSNLRYITKKKRFEIPSGGEVSRYLKIPKSKPRSDSHARQAIKRGASSKRIAVSINSAVFPSISTKRQNINPQSLFYSGIDDLDELCFKFYRIAFCSGRTLLGKTNVWESDILAMAAYDPSVWHALLALSGSYLLDYNPLPALAKRVGYHYNRATTLISLALEQRCSSGAGFDHELLAAMSLLTVDDVVNWELRLANGEPNWILAIRQANLILDQLDPGSRYWKAENIQCDKTTQGLGNWMGLACILSEIVTPLLPVSPKYGWLLGGSQEDTRKIHGSTGLCPKLLHIISQITHLSIMVKNHASESPIYVADEIRMTLKSFYQWSELSKGHPGLRELLRSCDLDENGKVRTAEKVTELTGETWVAAAQIYLHCRLYRKPRQHPAVQKAVRNVWECVVRMPYSGDLFTSQAPFCPIFLASLVSTGEKDRKFAEEWFTTVGQKGACRSSVPPVWSAVQNLWKWMDNGGLEEGFDKRVPVHERAPWWEKLVDRLISTEGYVSLT